MQKFSSTKTYADPLNSSTTKFAKHIKNKKISYFNLWKGKLPVKLGANSEIINIQHINDLIDIDLAIADDRVSFYV